MSLTIEQRMQVYRVLDAEANKAAKAAAKAQTHYHNTPASYGGSVERETAAMLLSLRNAQRDAAYAVVNAYFNDYIKDAA